MFDYHGMFLSLPVAVLRAFACVVLAVFAPGQFPDVVLVHVLGLLLQLLHLLFLHLLPALRDGLANLGESVVGVDLGDLFPSAGRPQQVSGPPGATLVAATSFA